VGTKEKSLKEDAAFDFFERYMGSIVFAHSAMEAFVNYEMPEDFTYESIRRDHTRRYSKAQIERWINLEEKLGDVLPSALKISSPRQQDFWKRYKELEAIRHDIIHFKSGQIRKTEGVATIWNRLLIGPLPEPYLVAKEVIAYFYAHKSEATPRWFRNCPF
jgi:hypothetical protein